MISPIISLCPYAQPRIYHTEKTTRVDGSLVLVHFEPGASSGRIEGEIRIKACTPFCWLRNVLVCVVVTVGVRKEEKEV